MTSLADLRKLALAATPGPWHDEYRSHDGYSVWSDTGMRLVAGYASTFDKINAAYIAALSPERVLALLDALELARWLRSQTCCENYHHDHRERHAGTDCPVEARIDAALAALTKE